MISDAEIECIAEGWIEEFSVEPYVLGAVRKMDAWEKLDHLIYHRPEEALLVFERISQKEMINWTIEGIAVGPLRTFLVLYDHQFDDHLSAIGRCNRSFRQMHAWALEGM